MVGTSLPFTNVQSLINSLSLKVETRMGHRTLDVSDFSLVPTCTLTKISHVPIGPGFLAEVTFGFPRRLKLLILDIFIV